MIDLFSYILYLWGSLLIIYIIGHIFYAFTSGPHEPVKRIFYKLGLGMLVLIMIYALFVTSGKSIMSGMFFLLLILAWKVRISIRHYKCNILSIEWKYLGLLFAIAVLILALQYKQFSGHAIHPDYSFYAGVGSFMKQTGIESVNMDWINSGLQSPTFYHYGEIWLAVAFSNILRVTILNSFLFITIPVLIIIFYTGTVAFIEQKFNLSVYKAYFLTLILFFLVVVRFFFLDDFSFDGYKTYWSGSLYMQKFMLISIAFIAFLLIDTNNTILKTFPLYFVSILFTTCAPVILGGLLLYFLIRSFIKGFTLENLQHIFLSGFTLLYIIIFYVITAIPNPYKTETVSLYSVVIRNLSSIQGVGLIFISFAVRLLDILFNIVPFFLLFLLINKAQRRELWNNIKRYNVLIFLLIISIIISSLFWTITDNIQLMTSISFPLLLIFNFGVIIYAFLNLKGWRFAFPIVLIIVNLYFVYFETNQKKFDSRFYSQIKNEIKQKGNYAFVQSTQSLIGTGHFMRNANYIIAFPDIRRYTDKYLPVNLSVYDIPYDTDNVLDATYVVQATEESSFYRYVEKNALNSDLKEAQNRFINENNIRFIIVERGLDWFYGRPFIIEKVFKSNIEPYDLYIIKTQND